ncbi:ATP-binding protein [Vibrio fluvialis]|nr:ATP-binding protein [Vibrio fluvialis]
MKNIFITEVEVKAHPFLKPIHVKMKDNNTLKPVIITGRNGTGKTTLLTGLHKFTNRFMQYPLELNQINESIKQTEGSIADPHFSTPNYKNTVSNWRRSLVNQHKSLNDLYGFVHAKFNVEELDSLFDNKAVIGILETRRKTQLTNVTAISQPKVSQTGNGTYSSQFLQYLVNIKSQQAFAIADAQNEEANKIAEWFKTLEKLFTNLFEAPITLNFDRTNLTFKIFGNGKELEFNNLSDGYSSAINIISEIILRMEEHKFGDYSQSGIIFIDEIETHLHVSLQRNILTMLRAFFPNVQFVVTTHSPFVISSVDDAFVIDMESGECFDQDDGFWKYSYEALVEGFFETEKFSVILESKIEEYERLTAVEIEKLSREERKALRKLTKELENVPLYKNESIEMKLKQLGLRK